MSKVKLCGLRRAVDIHAANRCLPDYVGFVFAESKRQVDAPTAAALRQALDPRIRSVGVFVNAPVLWIVDLCRQGVIDLVQLHGDEDEAYIEELRQLIGNPIIRALRVGDHIPPAPANADYLLLDAAAGSARGGTGQCFDWSLAKHLSRPCFLAGGLHLDNVRQAVETLHPFCVDVSSGVETDGWKDPEKMRRMVELVRSCG